MIYTDKSVKTFLLPRWLNTITTEERKTIYDKIVRDDLKNGGFIFGA